MSPRFKLTKSLLLSCTALIPVLLTGEAWAQAVNLGGAGNLIIPDGRTGTQVSVGGNTTDITTNTVRGNVGFNSFSQFQVGNGNNVNLHLPQNTETLVNIVRDGPAVVEGTVNALKSGAIGGNVVFSDPYGFVLGANGVINTGGLTVNTPTREFLEGAIGPDGNIDTRITDRLISGDVPLAPSGAVILNGQVNAQNNINIHAGSIDVGDEAALERHRDLFEATVNTSGAPAVGSRLVVQNGRIELVAAGNVNIGSKARISVQSQAANVGASVAIKAGGDLTIAQGAGIAASAAAGSAMVQLNATGNLVLNGAVLVTGTDGATAAAQLTAANIGVGPSGSITVRGGTSASGVSLLASTNIAFNGRIDTRGVVQLDSSPVNVADNAVAISSGNKVSLAAGNDIAFGGAGVIDASGTSGGDIYVVASRDLTMADGASVASRGTSGNGGFLELSGHRAVDFGAIKLDLTSRTGNAGMLLIDPADIVISNASTYVRGAAGSIIDNVGSVTIDADNSIVVQAGGRIDTYKAGSNALSVLLRSKAIRVEAGGVISARADTGYVRGDVKLEALSTDRKSSLQSNATASVVVNGTLVGKDVTLSATAQADTSYRDGLDDLLEVGFDGLVPTLTSGISQVMTGVTGGYVGAKSSAKVTVGSGAVIDASNNVSLIADGLQKTVTLGFNPGSGTPVRVTAFLGIIDGVTTAEVLGGAQIKAGGALSVTATNSLTMGLSAASLASKDTPMAGALAVGITNLDTQAVIHSGVNLQVRGAVSVVAENTNSLSVSASATTMGDGEAGFGIAVHFADIKANARLGSDVGTDTQRAGAVRVSATSTTLRNNNHATTTIGTSAVPTYLSTEFKARTNQLSTWAGIAQKAAGPIAPKEAVKGGLAVMYAEVDQSATASIDADVSPATTTVAGPSIVSSGNVSVTSWLSDAQIRSNAQASVESGKTNVSGAASDAGAVAVSIGLFDHVSHATIGRNVSIAAQNLGVSALSDVPLIMAYETANTPKEIIKVIASSINGNLGVVNNILTSYAGSLVSSQDVGLAASVNIFGVSHDTRAWIGSGAKITTRSTGETHQALQNGVSTSTAGWVAQTNATRDGVAAATKVFQAGVDVQAYSRTDTVNMAGSPAWFVVVGGNANQGGEGTSAGGALNVNLFNTTTHAGIGAGVEVNSAAAVTVNARTLDTIVSVAPTSGKGAAFGINGMMSYLGVTNSTWATISSDAIIRAKAVAVTANQELLIVSISGAISSGSGTNVGLSAAWSNLDTDTRAFIGNNDSAVAGTDTANLGGFLRGSISTDNLTVTANTAGAAYTMSVAAAIASPASGESSLVDSLLGGLGNGIGGLGAKLGGTVSSSSSKIGKLGNYINGGIASGLGSISDKLQPKAPPPGQKREAAIAGAGSISGVTTSFDTIAYLDGPTIKLFSNTGSVPITVKATNDLLISTTSGAAALALASVDSAKSSAAVSGAFAVAFSDNQTSAAIRNVSGTNIGQVRVTSIASGQQVVLGLGVAAATNPSKSLAIAGSISFGGSIDGVNSSIENSVLDATGTSDVDVLAYQNTDIGIGGLAVAVSTKGNGYGLALTGTVLADPTGSHAASARIVNSSLRYFHNLSVDAITVSRVMSGAGSVGVTPNGLGINGSILFNDVSTSTIAEITGTGTQRIETSGNVSVKAGSERRKDVEDELATVIRNKTIDVGFDFSDQVLGSGTTGAVIFGVSGTVGFGQKSAGAAIQYGSIRHDHEAYLSGVTLVSLGDLTVSARDESKIFGTAAGVSIGTGSIGGAGSLSINIIKNRTLAMVSGANTSVSARNVAIGAYNSSTAGGGAGAVGISVGGTGIGLSLINNTIDNSTEAAVEAASVTATGDIAIVSHSSGKLTTFAISVGAGADVGIGGSVATSIALNDALALVRGASLTASNNVLVSASNNDQIHAVAGGVGISLKAAGVGVATVANIVRGQTLAAIDDLGTTHSVIKTRATGSDLSADSGLVTTPFSYSGLDFTRAMATLLPDMSFSATAINGLGVVATSRQAVGSFSLAVSAAISLKPGASVAASVAPVINILGGNTTARINNALINSDSDTNGVLADVKVIAASNTFVQNVVIGAAGGTGLAVASGFVSNIMERNTTAEVTGSTIGNANASIGSVLIRATGTMYSFNTVAGVALGAVGAAGSMVVNVFDADTVARVSGGSLTARELAVDARSANSFLGVAGAGAGGGSAFAGAMSISVNLGSTQALVGNGDGDTSLVLADDLDVTATSIDRQAAYAVGAAIGGGGSGVAAMLNLSVILSDTIASVNRLTQSSMRDVQIAASNYTHLTPVTGGFGLSASGAGIGAGANVMLTKGTVSAEIVNSAFTARGTLDVTATGTRDISMITFTAGGGTSVGIGAALGIIVAGIDMSSDASKELGDTLNSANTQANQSANSQFVENGTPGQRNTDGDTRKNVVTSSVNSTKRDSVDARIVNSTLASGATTVLADSRLKVSNQAYGIGVGTVGVGAALAFTFVNQDVSASVAASDLTVSSLTVKALSNPLDTDPALLVRAYAGAGSLAGGLGAAIAVAHVESDITASVAGKITGGAGGVNVLAEDRLTVKTDALGASASGGLAIGVSLALSSRNADVQARLGTNSIVTAARGVSIAAKSFGSVFADSKAGAGGLFGAGVGASATALDNTTVLATIEDDASLTSIGADGVSVTAEATPEVKSRSLGVAVGGTGAVGASVSVSKAKIAVRATIGNNVSIASLGKFAVLANLRTGANPTLDSNAVAGSGALFVAANATVAQSILSAETTARIGNNAKLNLGTADAEVKSTTRTRQRTDNTGVSVSLGLALGANVAEVQSDTLTQASIGDNAMVLARHLTVEASGQDDNRGTGMAGGGGIISGSAAVVTNTALSQTKATIGSNGTGNGIDLLGKLTVKAAHENVLGGTVDSINAGLVGASGAVLRTDVNAIVDAKLADNVRASVADLELTASNITRKPWEGGGTSGDAAGWNLNSGSGGILNLPAGASRSTVAHVTTASMGKNASVVLDGKSSASAADVKAYNRIDFFDKVKLDSGGAIALADTRTYLTVTANNATVFLHEGARIVAPNGNIRLAAYDDATLELRAAATTYGIAGAPTGAAEIDYRRANLVKLAKNVTLLANSDNDLSTGSISVMAGASLDNTLSQINARTTLDLYNNALIPISIVPNPVTRVSGNSIVLMEGGSTATDAGLRAAADIRLTASRGNISATAVGTGKDVYRQALAELASAVSELFGGGKVTFDYKGGTAQISGAGTADINSVVMTGIGRHKSITFSYATENTPNCNVATAACLLVVQNGNIGYTVTTGVTVATTITKRLAELRQLFADYRTDAVAAGAYRSEIAYLEAKLVALGLSKDGATGAFTAPTEFEAAQKLLVLNKLELNGIGAAFDINTVTVNTAATTGSTSGSTIVTNASAAETAASTGTTASYSIVAAAKTLGNYNATANSTFEASIATLQAANATLASDIATLRGDVTAARNAIDTANATIATAQATIASKQQAVLNKPYGTAASEIAALEAEIETARQTVVGATATINTKLDEIAGKSNDIATKAGSISTNLATIDTNQQTIVNNSKATGNDLTAITALQRTLTGAKTSAATASSNVTAARTSVTGQQTTASASVVKIASYSSDRVVIAGQISTIESKIAANGYSKTNSALPSTDALTVNDTAARLGDIIITADRLVGTGQLSAPGDAKISVVNNTANVLQVQNLTIDSDSGGRIRFNGGLVNDLAQINALNANGYAAQFASVLTATTQGNILPTINIASNYTTDSAAFFDPRFDPTSPSYSASATSPYFYLRTPKPAPDIVLLANKILSNPRGAVNITSEAGNVYMQGNTQAGSVNIVAKKGDYVQSFVYGFEHIGGDPAGGVTPGTGILANGAVNISARYLNINSTIQSGIANLKLTIGSNPWLVGAVGELGLSQQQLTDIAAHRTAYSNSPSTVSNVLMLDTGKLRFDASADNGAGQIQFTTGYLDDNNIRSGSFKLQQVGTNNIGASFNAADNNFVVDASNVRGGSIQIYGQILNTSSTSGALNVLDGFGQIDIVNNDGRNIVLGKLDAGEDPLGNGRGVAGRIEITDIYSLPTQTQPKVVAVKTIYTRNNGMVTGDRIVGYINGTGEFITDESLVVRGGSADIAGTDRAASYLPQLGIRYVYTTGVDNSTKTITQYKGAEFLGNSDWRIPTGATVVSQKTVLLKSYRLNDGTYVAFDTAAGTVPVTVSNGAATETVTDSWRTCNWWTLCIAASYNVIMEKVTPTKTITTTTMIADNPIKIGFIGTDKGTINVTSANSVVLNGALNNKSGTTTIKSTAGNIVQGNASALITANAIDLQAAGSVGGTAPGSAVRISLGSGDLNAVANAGNVVIQANTAIQVGTIKAAGTASAQMGKVLLDANGSIGHSNTAGVTSLIQAPRVELVSRYGNIGATGNALVVNTSYDSATSDAARIENLYSGLKASAAGNIDLKSNAWASNADGTMLVDQIVSSGGNVTLTTAGAILDNNPIQSIDTRTYDQLLNYWNSLGLVAGASNTQKTAAVISSFERQIASEQRIYQQMRGRQANPAAGYDANFAYTMSPTEKAAFRASIRLGDTSLSDAQVDVRVSAYETEQTARYHRTHAELAQLTGTFDGAGNYTASAVEKAARQQGAVWTERELAFSLSPGALKTITGTNPVIKDPNVSGRIVTLNADKGLGNAAGIVSIPTNIAPRDLTDAQKIALATAERTDFVSTSGGQIQIRQVQALNFAAIDRLNATITASGANAYLSSMGDARLGTISVPGELRIKVRGSIVNANTASLVSAGSFILEAAHGGIGLAPDSNGTLVPGTLRIAAVNTTGTPGAYKGTIVARSGLGIDLAVNSAAGQPASGDANVDTIYARGAVKLVADKSIRNANGDQLINILGDSISLQAKDGAVGTATNRLNLGNVLGGWVDIASTGSIYANVPSGFGLALRTLVAGDVVDATAFGDLTLSGNINAPVSASFKVGGRLAMTGGQLNAGAGGVFVDANTLRMLSASRITSAGAVTIRTHGDAQVTNIASAATGPRAISINAGGRILAGTVPSRTDLLTTTSGAGIMLVANNGIGDKLVVNTSLDDAKSIDRLNHLRVNTATVDANTGTGTIAIHVLNDVTGSAFQTLGGSIDLVADASLKTSSLLAGNGALSAKVAGELSVDTAVAGTGFDATAGGSIMVRTVTSGGTQRLSANGGVSFDALKSFGTSVDVGNIIVSSANGLVSGGNVNANGSIITSAKGRLTLNQLNSGRDITANAGGDLAVDTVSAGGRFSATAGGRIVVNSVTSGGSQNIVSSGDLVFNWLKSLGIANDVGNIALSSANGSVLGGNVDANGSLLITARDRLTFSRLRAGLDMDLVAGGAAQGDDLDAGGALRFDFGGTTPVRLKKIVGSELNVQNGGGLFIDRVDVSKSASFQAPNLVIGKLNHTGSGELALSITGYRGSVGDSARADLNATSGIRVDRLYLKDARFRSNGADYRILDGQNAGSLEWQTPWRAVWMNNRSPQPTKGNDVQLNVPGYRFSMSQTGNRTLTNAYVVQYGLGSETGMLWNGQYYLGASAVRDYERALQLPAGLSGSRLERNGTPKSASGWSSMMSWMRALVNNPVTNTYSKPAVNLDGENGDQAALR